MCNAFSLSMIQKTPAAIGVWEVSLEQVKKLLSNGFTSAVGHPSTAQLLTKLLGVNVPVNRVQVKLDDNTILVVFQLMQRLPEGKILTEEELKQLPHKWFLVATVDAFCAAGGWGATVEPASEGVRKLLTDANIDSVVTASLA